MEKESLKGSVRPSKVRVDGGNSEFMGRGLVEMLAASGFIHIMCVCRVSNYQS